MGSRTPLVPGSPRRLSIKLGLMLALLLVAGVAVLVLSADRYRWLSVELERDERTEDLELARAVSLGVDRFIRLRQALIAALAEELAVGGLRDLRAIAAVIDPARRRESSFATLGVVDARGVTIAVSPPVDATGAKNVGRSYADREWFQEARAGAPPSLHVVIGRIIQRPTVGVASAVRSPDGQLLGVVFGAVELEGIRSAVREIAPGTTDRLVVTDGRGRVIAHSSRDWEATAHDLSGEAVFQASLRAPEGVLDYVSEFSRTTRPAAFRRVPSTGWVVWASRGPEVRAARLRSLLQSMVVSGGISLAVAGIAAVVISQALTQPVRRLADSARQIAEGGRVRGESLPRSTTMVREFADLDGAFRTMAAAVDAQHGALEARVAERTRALEQAAREAEATAARLRAQDAIRRGYGELAALLNSLDRSHILNESVAKIAASIQAPVVAVFLATTGPESLRLKTYWAIDADAVDAALLAPSGLPRRVAETLRPIEIAAGAASETLRLSTGVGEITAAAVLGYPLQLQDKLLGVLVVALPARPDDDHRSFLDSAARQLSVALNNAELFEAVRYQSQRMEQLNTALRRASEAKSQFLSSMSHELRTPLNGIIGFTDVLLMSGRDPLTERQRAALEKVRASGGHLLGLINQVLDLSKIEAGRMEAHPNRVRLADLVPQCLATVEPQAQAKGLRLAALGLEAAPELFQDGDKVKQILVNLLSNAVKFTTAGDVQVRVSPPDEERIDIAVSDTGIGIPPEQQALIFEDFHQVDGNGRVSGTGLGLAISRRLVELLGGTLGVESEPGRGSVFTLRLPVRFTPRPARQASSLSAVMAGDTRVLAIEDDANAVEILREATADQPIHIEWAPSAKEGLERARAQRPDAIVLDVMLDDGADGWDVLAQLKKDPATSAIPVIVHSVIDNPGLARKLGAAEVLPKPATPAAIAALLRRFQPRHTDGDAAPAS